MVTGWVEDRVNNDKDNQQGLTWKSVKTLTPLFLIAGIYQKDPNRRRVVNIIWKIYCGIVLLLLLITCCFSLIDTIIAGMTFACSQKLIWLIMILLKSIYFFVMVIAWVHINRHLSYYCSVLDNLSCGHGGMKPLTYSKIMKILKSVAWIWFSITLIMSLLHVY